MSQPHPKNIQRVQSNNIGEYKPQIQNQNPSNLNKIKSEQHYNNNQNPNNNQNNLIHNIIQKNENKTKASSESKDHKKMDKK